MNILTCIETYLTKKKNYYGLFIIEPLELGQGITLGNAIRRTLLSDLTSYSITGIRINNIKHEFSIIEGLREDILELILNLKEIIFKSSYSILKQHNKYKAFLNIKGPCIITAGMFQLPKLFLKIINPNQYIGTLTKNINLYIEIEIENYKGYNLNINKNLNNYNNILKPNLLLLDTNFISIKKINYKIKLIYDSYGNLKESLILEILTNGSISPKRSIQEGVKILISILYPLLITYNYNKLLITFLKNGFFNL